jgi:hypothetical protein
MRSGGRAGLGHPGLQGRDAATATPTSRCRPARGCPAPRRPSRRPCRRPQPASSSTAGDGPAQPAARFFQDYEVGGLEIAHSEIDKDEKQVAREHQRSRPGQLPAERVGQPRVPRRGAQRLPQDHRFERLPPQTQQAIARTRPAHQQTLQLQAQQQIQQQMQQQMAMAQAQAIRPQTPNPKEVPVVASSSRRRRRRRRSSPSATQGNQDTLEPRTPRSREAAARGAQARAVARRRSGIGDEPAELHRSDHVQLNTKTSGSGPTSTRSPTRTRRSPTATSAR